MLIRHVFTEFVGLLTVLAKLNRAVPTFEK